MENNNEMLSNDTSKGYKTFYANAIHKVRGSLDSWKVTDELSYIKSDLAVTNSSFATKLMRLVFFAKNVIEDKKLNNAMIENAEELKELCLKILDIKEEELPAEDKTVADVKLNVTDDKLSSFGNEMLAKLRDVMYGLCGNYGSIPDVSKKFLLAIRSKNGHYQSKEETTSNINIPMEALFILKEILPYLYGRKLESIILSLREVCEQMQKGDPYGILIANVTRRVSYAIRDEYAMELKASDEEGLKEDEVNFNRLKDNILERISSVDFLQEFDSVCKDISKQAVDHIAEEETILTYGYSKTIESFLVAAKKTNLSVIICEAAPRCGGHRLAAKLVEQGIKVTVIPDSLAYGYMSRVSKVIISAHLVFADGEMIGPSGCHGVAVAAKNHKVPVMVCASTMKMTPKNPSDLSEFSKCGCPEEIIPMSLCIASTDESGTNKIRVVNQTVDNISSDLISLYITNDDCGRAYTPSCIYRLISQLYKSEDSDF